jgi:CheY-like chemotaxis protein
MRKKRILVVDPDAGFTRLVQLGLEKTGEYEVRIEKWPEDVVGTAGACHPDLIVLDIMMPRMFGGDVAAMLRHDPRFRTVPILFLSAAVRKDWVTEHEGHVAGFPLLAKPVTTDELIWHIEHELACPATAEDLEAQCA